MCFGFGCLLLCGCCPVVYEVCGFVVCGVFVAEFVTLLFPRPVVGLLCYFCFGRCACFGLLLRTAGLVWVGLWFCFLWLRWLVVVVG